MPSMSHTAALAPTATQPQRSDVLHRDLGERFSLLAATSASRRRARSVISSARPSSSRSRGPRSARRRRERPDGAADLSRTTVPRLPGDDRRAPGGQVGLARELQVEWLKPLRRLQQQRGSIAAETRGEGDLAAQQVHPGALELVERPGLRRGQEPESRVERAGLEASLRGGQRALRAPRRVRASARRRAAGTRPRRRARRAPAPGRPSARAPRRPARRAPPRPRPDARPGGPDRPPDRSPPPAPDGPPGVPAPPLIGTRRSAPADDGTSPARRSPAARPFPRQPPTTAIPSRSAARQQQQRIADRLRRREQQQTPRVVRERLESSDEALLDPP